MAGQNPVGWFEIYVSDIERAKKFYEAVFELKLEKLPQSGGSLDDMWSFPMHKNGSGAAGALAKMQGAPSGPGGTIVYFVANDCGEVAARAAKSGGQIVKDKFSIGEYGKIALIKDPDGNIVGVHSMA